MHARLVSSHCSKNHAGWPCILCSLRPLADAALEAKRRGCVVIGISSADFCRCASCTPCTLHLILLVSAKASCRNTPKDFPARHSTGLNLYEVADIHINNHIPKTEGIVSLPDFPQVMILYSAMCIVAVDDENAILGIPPTANRSLVHLSLSTTQAVGSPSTILQSSIINWLVVETIRQCTALGVVPPVWMSANLVGGDAKNKANMEKYSKVVKFL